MDASMIILIILLFCVFMSIILRCLPSSDNDNKNVKTEGANKIFVEGNSDKLADVVTEVKPDGGLDALGSTLCSGRDFTATDSDTAPKPSHGTSRHSIHVVTTDDDYIIGEDGIERPKYDFFRYPSSTEEQISIVGMQYCDIPEDIIGRPSMFALEMDYDNAYDSFAIEVLYNFERIGYVTSEHNKRIYKSLENASLVTYDCRGYVGRIDGSGKIFGKLFVPKDFL